MFGAATAKQLLRRLLAAFYPNLHDRKTAKKVLAEITFGLEMNLCWSFFAISAEPRRGFSRIFFRSFLCSKTYTNALFGCLFTIWEDKQLM